MQLSNLLLKVMHWRWRHYIYWYQQTVDLAYIIKLIFGRQYGHMIIYILLYANQPRLLDRPEFEPIGKRRLTGCSECENAKILPKSANQQMILYVDQCNLDYSKHISTLIVKKCSIWTCYSQVKQCCTRLVL